MISESGNLFGGAWEFNCYSLDSLGVGICLDVKDLLSVFENHKTRMIRLGIHFLFWKAELMVFWKTKSRMNLKKLMEVD